MATRRMIRARPPITAPAIIPAFLELDFFAGAGARVGEGVVVSAGVVIGSAIVIE